MSKSKSNVKQVVAASLIITIILVLTYLASTGPVIWLGSRGYFSLDFYFAYTAPLGWFASCGEFTKGIVVWWIRFWVNDPRP